MSELEYAEENKYEIDGIRIGSVAEVRYIPEEADPFESKAVEVLKYKGLSTSFKRSNSRTLSKMRVGEDGAKSKQIEVPYLAGYQLFDVMTPPYNLDYLAQIYEISPPQYAAVNAKVKNVVGLGYDLIESYATKKKLEEINDPTKLDAARKNLADAKQELLDRIDAFNEEDTFVETMIKVWTDYEVTGNGYMEIGRTAEGKIGYIGHIPSTSMRVRRLRDGFVQLISNKAVFFRNFGDQSTVNPIGNDPNPNEVIHFKNYSPNNGFYGVPDIISAKMAVAGSEFAARYNLDYFENKAVPRYVITVKGATLSDTAERRLLEFFQANVKGKNHRTLYVPLPPDTQGNGAVEFKMEAVEAGVQDSSFTNYRAANLSDILMVNNVPLSKVSISESASLAAARDADKTFKESICRPLQGIFEKKFNRVVKELTDIFLFTLNEFTLTDEDTQSTIDERSIRNKLATPNEIRARQGLPGLPDGDKVVETQSGAGTTQQAAEARTQAAGTRVRDQQRTANATDTKGEARNPQGDGRTTP